MIYGVTGPHRLLAENEKFYVRRIVKRNVLRNPNNKLVSGMAFGVDTEAIIAVWGLMPFENIICTIPGTCNHNRDLAEKLTELGAVIINVPNKHTVGQTYLARDDVTVAQVGPHGRMLAFPNKENEEQRSGTWATIRRAYAANVRTRLYSLDRAWLAEAV